MTPPQWQHDCPSSPVPVVLHSGQPECSQCGAKQKDRIIMADSQEAAIKKAETASQPSAGRD